MTTSTPILCGGYFTAMEDGNLSLILVCNLQNHYEVNRKQQSALPNSPNPEMQLNAAKEWHLKSKQHEKNLEVILSEEGSV